MPAEDEEVENTKQWEREVKRRRKRKRDLKAQTPNIFGPDR